VRRRCPVRGRELAQMPAARTSSGRRHGPMHGFERCTSAQPQSAAGRPVETGAGRAARAFKALRAMGRRARQAEAEIDKPGADLKQFAQYRDQLREQMRPQMEPRASRCVPLVRVYDASMRRSASRCASRSATGWTAWVIASARRGLRRPPAIVPAERAASGSPGRAPARKDRFPRVSTASAAIRRRPPA